MIRFDAYTATSRAASSKQLIGILGEICDGPISWQQGRGFHTFGERLAAKDESGAEYGHVMWGGRQGDVALIEVKGERTPAAVEALRGRFPHRVTRVDSCADFDAPGAFERLLGPCLEVKKDYRLKGSRLGDWEDFPEDGRTLYLGAPSSVARVRLYEKGKQPEYRHLDRPNWARLEVQVRPAKEAKADYARLEPATVWGASKWTRELAGKLLEQHVDPHPAGTVYRRSERDAALAWMCKQYGSSLVSLADDLGSWECLGLTLREMVNEEKKGG